MRTYDGDKCRTEGAAQGDRSTYNSANYSPSIARPYDGAVVLDFGRPAYKDGIFQTVLFDNSPAVYAMPAQIINCVEQYAWGFYFHTPPLANDPPHLRILIGTSNAYLDSTSNNIANKTDAYGHGNMWAGLTNKVSDYVASNSGLAQQITVGAAMDIETSWSKHGGTNGVDRWYQGYNERPAQHTIYNYGDAGGCPVNTNTAFCDVAPLADTYQYPGDWYQSSILWLSGQGPWTRAIPEIYTPDGVQATQWQQIALYGYLYTSNHVRPYFYGEMTQYNSCGSCENTPQHGWTQLQDRLLNNDPIGGHPSTCTAPPSCHRTDADIYHSTDIGWSVK
jgi:hypothetical protein